MSRKQMFILPEFANKYMNTLLELLKKLGLEHKIISSPFCENEYIIQIYDPLNKKNLMLENYGESQFRHEDNKIVSYNFMEVKNIVTNLNIHTNNIEMHEKKLNDIILSFFHEDIQIFKEMLDKSDIIEHRMTK